MIEEIRKNITPELLNKYNVQASYFTAYPPSGVWSHHVGSTDYANVLSRLEQVRERGFPLSLYVHFPYCTKICYYCQCYALVDRGEKKSKAVLENIYKEIDLIRNILDSSGTKLDIREVHLGGGSPSILSKENFSSLLERISTIVDLSSLDELSIEIDPRTVDEDMLVFYHSMGINRISYGVQDVEPEVQSAIGREQPFELICKLSSPNIRGMFKGMNWDLLYGMPKQTMSSWQRTLERTVQISPDRLTVCNMGYRPDIFPHNKLIKADDIPGLYDKTMMGVKALEFLTKHGYQRIGLDHYAKPTDELASARCNRTLHRNTMGYTPGRSHDTLGIGPSAITRVNDYYFQNEFDLDRYGSMLSNGLLPVIRGHHLTREHLIRRDIMFRVFSYYQIDYKFFEEKYDINFKAHFRDELNSPEMEELVEDGLAELHDDRIQATPTGTFFLRNICYVFDNLDLGYKHNIQAYSETRKQKRERKSNRTTGVITSTPPNKTSPTVEAHGDSSGR